MVSFKRTVAVFIVALAIVLCTSSADSAPFKVITGQYKLQASIDPLVTTLLKTELWARIWRPNTGGPYPLVVFLHGNHATCGRFHTDAGVRIDDRLDYTRSGKCPSGYVVTPNHLGYAYLATSLASHGYVVVSINANRGVNGAKSEDNDFGLNLRRGRLVLRHLQKLAQWNAGAEAPASLGFQLKGLIDFSQVGLMGHSRGGEGMRAAVAQYRDPDSPWPELVGPVKFRSLFEIAPVDGQTSRTLNAVDLVWNVLLPGCDGDVTTLEGIRPFDRVLQITSEAKSLSKSTIQVFGANHNFYNTQWQISDAVGCLGQTPIFPLLVGSPAQRRTALNTLIPFFQSNLGTAPSPSLAMRFDPSYPLPAGLASVTSYARGFTRSPRAIDNFIIDDFDQSTGTSSRNVANQYSGLSLYQHGGASNNEDPVQRAAAVDWVGGGGFLQVNAATGQGLDVSGYHALEFRVMLHCFGTLCTSLPDPTGDLNFSIALADANGTLSEGIALRSRALVRRPGGSFDSSSSYCNELFQTVRIPLSAFTGADLLNFVGVRFTFDLDERSSIYLANVRLTKAFAGPGAATPSAHPEAEAYKLAQQTGDPGEPQPDLNQIAGIRPVARLTTAADMSAAPHLEIELASTRHFPVSDALPILLVGEKTFKLSHYPSGATDRLVFTLKAEDLETIPQGAQVSVRIGAARPWKFGSLDKSSVPQ